MGDLTKEEKMAAEAAAKQKMKESIARRKEEARLKKEQEEKERAEAAAKEAEEKARLKEERKKKREAEIQQQRAEKQAEEERLAAEQKAQAAERKKKQKELIAKQKEEAERKREEEEALKKEQAAEEAERQQLAEERLQKHREQAAVEREEKQKEEEARKAEEEAKAEEARRKQREQFQRTKEEAQRKREEEERLQAEKAEEEAERIRQQEERIQKHREQAISSKESKQREEEEARRREREQQEEAQRAAKEKILRAKQEAIQKREEAERAAAIDEEARQKELEAEAAEGNASAAEKLRKHKEEVQRQRKEAEEAARLEKEQAEAEALRNQEEMKKKIQERKALNAEAGEKQRLEKEAQRQAEEEERQRLLAEQRRTIEANKEEARRRREEEENEEKAKKEAEQAARKKEMAERKARRKAELAAKKEAQAQQEKEKREKEQAEAQKKEEERKQVQKERREALLKQKAAEEAEEQKIREENEAKRLQLEEEQRVAMKKHLDEVRARQEEEKNLEEEERQRLEAERAAEFEAIQAKRKVEMERIIKEEAERRQKAEEKIKALGHKAPVNRCGLFSVFGEEPGLEIWVLGDQQISKIAKQKHGLRGLIGESHGSFHTERAYIILHTAFAQGLYHYRLHSWIGAECPEDMRSQAEERLNELEAGLVMDDLETITREYQREEAEEFRAYFDKPLEYVESVTLKATTGPNYLDKSLYMLKGRNYVHCKRIDPLAENLSSGDVYVLEDSFGIYQFNGRKSNKMERGKALDLGVQLRIERNARVRVHIIDEGNPQCEHENNKFWAALLLDRDEKGEYILPEGHPAPSVTGGTPTGLQVPITPPEECGDDEEFEKAYVASWKMWEICPVQLPKDLQPTEDLEVVMKEMELTPKGPLVSQLNEWKCVVLDCDTEIFVWYGNFSTQEARRQAREKAKALSQEAQRSPCTIVSKVRQQTEGYMFKEKFVGSWGEYADFDFTEEHIRGNIAVLEQEDVNVDCMYFPEKYANATEDRAMPIPNKDPSVESTLEIYLVTGHDKIELEEAEHGTFYTGNCYVMMYEMKFGVDQSGKAKSRHVVYFWQGWHASREDKGLSALIAGDVAKRLRFSQVVRVVQNKEPDHFLSHFAPTMKVCLGSRPAPAMPFSGKRLYHIRGTNAENSHAVETVPKALALNTNDAFVLMNDDKVFVWDGKGANEHERECSNALAKISGHDDMFEVEEGNEGEAFWEILGSKGKYISMEQFHKGDISAVIFECTNTIGIFKVYRLDDFSQEDLLARNCILLDAGNRLFVWVGSDANEKCLEMSKDTAQKYINFESDEHPKRAACEMVIVHAGSEPLEFQAYFHTWDMKNAKESRDTYQAKLNEMRATHALASPLPKRRIK